MESSVVFMPGLMMVWYKSDRMSSVASIGLRLELRSICDFSCAKQGSQGMNRERRGPYRLQYSSITIEKTMMEKIKQSRRRYLFG